MRRTESGCLWRTPWVPPGPGPLLRRLVLVVFGVVVLICVVVMLVLVIGDYGGCGG